MHLDIKVEHETNYHVIALTGRLDNLTASEFAAAINSEIDSGTKQVLIEGSGLQYVSSAGIAELLAAGKRLQESGGNLIFAALTKPVQSVFEIVGFPKLFRIYETRDSALAGSES